MKLIFFIVLALLIYFSEDNKDLFNMSNYIQDNDLKTNKTGKIEILSEIFMEEKSKQWLHMEYFTLIIDFFLIYLNYWMFNNSFKSHENVLFYIVHIAHKVGLMSNVSIIVYN